jgi:ubiquinone/menaquinone biosynthesis C-methylase UbiE
VVAVSLKKVRGTSLDHGPSCEEREVYTRLLPLDGARVLELGCGTAVKTREIAQHGGVKSILALEVDELQHAENVKIEDLGNVRFALGGAERIPAPSSSFDLALMFKSLHHVPIDRMDDALAELHRVLRPGGLAYISEPIFAGEYNDILRLFHDERVVREAAFRATCRVVENGRFELVTQEFFSTPTRFEGFEDFDRRVLRVTHTKHSLPDSLRAEVRRRIEARERDGVVEFSAPIRVDLLRRCP